METKQIRINKSTYDILCSLGTKNDSISDIIENLIKISYEHKELLALIEADKDLEEDNVVTFNTAQELKEALGI